MSKKELSSEPYNAEKIWFGKLVKSKRLVTVEVNKPNGVESVVGRIQSFDANVVVIEELMGGKERLIYCSEIKQIY